MSIHGQPAERLYKTSHSNTPMASTPERTRQAPKDRGQSLFLPTSLPKAEPILERKQGKEATGMGFELQLNIYPKYETKKSLQIQVLQFSDTELERRRASALEIKLLPFFHPNHLMKMLSPLQKKKKKKKPNFTVRK